MYDHIEIICNTTNNQLIKPCLKVSFTIIQNLYRLTNVNTYQTQSKDTTNTKQKQTKRLDLSEEIRVVLFREMLAFRVFMLYLYRN